ncbi:MAG: NADH-quinone oxidoreductase subunit M [Planctomycetaceae bacterium]
MISHIVATLAEHSVFLLLVLPIVGAILVILTAGLGLDVIRRTVLTNVLLSMCLSILMVAHYAVPDSSADKPPRVLQMASELHVIPDSRSADIPSNSKPTDSQPTTDWNIRVAVGVDGLSVWFVASVAFLMLPVVIGHWNMNQQPAVFYCLLLASQSSLVGIFASLDLIMFLASLEAASLFLFFLVGQWGETERRQISCRFFLFQLGSDLLIFLGLILVVLLHSWIGRSESQPDSDLVFSITRLTVELPDLILNAEAGYEYWKTVRWLILTPLILGFAIKAAMFPVHRWLSKVVRVAPVGVGILLCGAMVNIGIYGFARFLHPLFQVTGSGINSALMGWILTASLLAGLIAITQREMDRLLAYAIASGSALCIAGICSASLQGITGAILRTVSLGFSFAGIVFLFGVLRSRYSTLKIRSFSGLASEYPRLFVLLLLFILAGIATPGTGGFTGLFTLLWGIFLNVTSHQVSLLPLIGGICGVLLIAAAWMGLLHQVFGGPLREPNSDDGQFDVPSRPISWLQKKIQREMDQTLSTISVDQQERAQEKNDLAPREWLSLLPMFIAMLVMGIAPFFFTARIAPTIKRYMPEQQTTVRHISRQRAESNKPSITRKNISSSQSRPSGTRLHSEQPPTSGGSEVPL